MWYCSTKSMWIYMWLLGRMNLWEWLRIWMCTYVNRFWFKCDCFLLWLAKAAPSPPTWLILEERRWPKATTEAELSLLLMYPFIQAQQEEGKASSLRTSGERQEAKNMTLKLTRQIFREMGELDIRCLIFRRCFGPQSRPVILVPELSVCTWLDD